MNRRILHFWKGRGSLPTSHMKLGGCSPSGYLQSLYNHESRARLKLQPTLRKGNGDNEEEENVGPTNFL